MSSFFACPKCHAEQFSVVKENERRFHLHCSNHRCGTVTTIAAPPMGLKPAQQEPEPMEG